MKILKTILLFLAILNTGPSASANSYIDNLNITTIGNLTINVGSVNKEEKTKLLETILEQLEKKVTEVCRCKESVYLWKFQKKNGYLFSQKIPALFATIANKFVETILQQLSELDSISLKNLNENYNKIKEKISSSFPSLLSTYSYVDIENKQLPPNKLDKKEECLYNLLQTLSYEKFATIFILFASSKLKENKLFRKRNFRKILAYSNLYTTLDKIVQNVLLQYLTINELQSLNELFSSNAFTSILKNIKKFIAIVLDKFPEKFIKENVPQELLLYINKKPL